MVFVVTWQLIVAVGYVAAAVVAALGVALEAIPLPAPGGALALGVASSDSGVVFFLLSRNANKIIKYVSRELFSLLPILNSETTTFPVTIFPTFHNSLLSN